MKKNSMKFWLNSSWINNANKRYIENVYKTNIKDILFLKNFFNNKQHFSTKKQCNDKNIELDSVIKKNEIDRLINNYRVHGHKIADLDPLKLFSKKKIKNLELCFYNIKNKDLENTVLLNYFREKITIRPSYSNILTILKKIYCSTIGFEYMHIENCKEIQWIQNFIEHKHDNFLKNSKEKIKILKNIILANNFEKYLHYKFPGSKRFSLEGADVLIPLLQEIINYSEKNYISKIIIGMAHRGRLNVLTNVLKKPPSDLFNEFLDISINTDFNGDVKYHKGFNCKLHNNIEIILKPNPSHLEFINPIILGVTRSYIDFNKNINKKILPIIIHGDASFTGQGIVQETLNMSQTTGYCVEGTIHIIINNQIGFTTSNVKDLRSSTYCTDIAKMIKSPIFHVNADDPDAVIFIIQLALLFKLNFKKDVFIDLICYRRNGHNEFDDPYVTQPIMYNLIQKHRSVQDIYFNKLQKLKIISSSYLNNIVKEYTKFLDIEYNLNKKKKDTINKKYNLSNQNKINNLKFVDNNISKSYLSKLAYLINIIPDKIQLHKKINNIYLNRIKMAEEKQLFDWGASEILSYASLIDEGISCRLSGQDIGRGTFFHRHAIVYDQLTNNSYIPLQNIKSFKGKFEIWNSVLSETSVLAFEYGYATTSKKTLTIWEAQFGDFSNVAQVIIDQFISSGEQKWNVLCNLVIFLPHGYEGQGPEHSSARLERFLQLCAQNNMQIIVPTTSAQIYHLLRRQMLYNILKPLIIFTPKSILRNPLTFSSLNELSAGNFKSVINELDTLNTKQIKKIIFCTGKLYFDLLLERRKQKINDIMIIRIEELYPFPTIIISKIISPFLYVKKFLWCQEEPFNQGAWIYIEPYLKNIIPVNSLLICISRESSSSPAVGSYTLHINQQQQLIRLALNLH